MWYRTIVFAAVMAVSGQCGQFTIDTATVCKEKIDGTFVRSATSCHHYLICFGGKVVHEGSCTKGLAFNANSQTCGAIEANVCMEYFFQPIETIEVKPIDMLSSNVCAGVGERDFIASTTSCKHYIFCHDTIAEEGECPVSHIFDPVDKVCVDAGGFGCMNSEPVETMIEPFDVNFAQPEESKEETLEDRVCKGIVDGTFVASPNSCANYFLCNDNLAEESSCPDGYAFNEEEQSCDPKDEVDCLLCPKIGKIDFIDPKTCNYYYSCNNGVRTLFECGYKLRFDQNSRTCKPRKEVRCDMSNVCHYQDKKKNDYVAADANDCKKYHLCKNEKSKPKVFECANGLLFNSKTLMCEMEYRVESCLDNVPLLFSEVIERHPVEGQNIAENRLNGRRIRPPTVEDQNPNARPITPQPPGPDAEDPAWEIPGAPPRRPDNWWGPPPSNGGPSFDWGDGGGDWVGTTTTTIRPPGGLPIWRPKPEQRPPQGEEEVTWGPPRLPSGMGGGGGGPQWSDLADSHDFV